MPNPLTDAQLAEIEAHYGPIAGAPYAESRCAGQVLALVGEVRRLRELLMDVFSQGTRMPDGRYDNFCISAYEDATDYLLAAGLVKYEELVRP